MTGIGGYSIVGCTWARLGSAWSPVEDVIAYFEPRGPAGGTRLRFVTGDGHPRGDLVASDEPTAFGNGLLGWSADGQKVAVVSLPGAAAGSLWIAELGATPKWRKLVDLQAGVHLRGITWSRDGSELIVGVIRWSGDIVLAERTH